MEDEERLASWKPLIPIDLESLLDYPHLYPIPRQKIELLITLSSLGEVLFTISDLETDQKLLKAIIRFLNRFPDDVFPYVIATLRHANLIFPLVLEQGDIPESFSRKIEIFATSVDLIEELQHEMEKANKELLFITSYLFPLQRRNLFFVPMTRKCQFVEVFKVLEAMTCWQGCADSLTFDWSTDAWNDDPLLFLATIDELLVRAVLDIVKKRLFQVAIVRLHDEQPHQEVLNEFLSPLLAGFGVNSFEELIHLLENPIIQLDMEEQLQRLVKALRDPSTVSMLAQQSRVRYQSSLRQLLSDVVDQHDFSIFEQDFFPNLLVEFLLMKTTSVPPDLIERMRFYFLTHDWKPSLILTLQELLSGKSAEEHHRQLIQEKIANYCNQLEHVQKSGLLLKLVRNIVTEAEDWKLVRTPSVFIHEMRFTGQINHPFELILNFKEKMVSVTFTCRKCHYPFPSESIHEFRDVRPRFTPCIVAASRSDRFWTASRHVTKEVALFIGKINLLLIYFRALLSDATFEDKLLAKELVHVDIRTQFARQFDSCPHFDWILQDDVP